jgi:hypothetical protein
MTDFRALCAELLADYDNCHYRSELSDRARAALAQPEPQGPKLVYRYSPVTIAECGGPCEQGPQYCDCGEIKGEPAPVPVAPTDEELWDLYQHLGSYFSPTEFARTVLARWGTPTNTINQED